MNAARAARVWTCAVACALGAIAAAGPARAAWSPIAYPVLQAGAGAPRLELAQRVITRSWGQSEDSVYVVVEVPEWRSEGGALVMSAVLPGAGELYVGERSGWLFLLAEAAGWAAHFFLKDKADERRDEAAAYAGDPRDATSVWSLERWAEATQQDPAALEQLYAGDPGGFYEAIRDPSYAAGFVGDESRMLYETLQSSADRRRRYARYAAMGLWLNHAISAFDALRAARIRNLPLRRNLQLRLRPSLGDGAGFTAALEGSF
jgi:hypothetical protein